MVWVIVDQHYAHHGFRGDLNLEVLRSGLIGMFEGLLRDQRSHE